MNFGVRSHLQLWKTTKNFPKNRQNLATSFLKCWTTATPIDPAFVCWNKGTPTKSNKLSTMSLPHTKHAISGSKVASWTQNSQIWIFEIFQILCPTHRIFYPERKFLQPHSLIHSNFGKPGSCPFKRTINHFDTTPTTSCASLQS